MARSVARASAAESMTATMALLAMVVAAMYALIAVLVVPQLARVAMHGTRSIPVVFAAVGAGTFFVGCAVTHVVIALHGLNEHRMQGSGDVADLFGHVLPHIAQIAGGVTFIVVARRHLDIRILRRDDLARVDELERRLHHALDAGRLGAWGIDLRTGEGWHSSQHDRIFGHVAPTAEWNMETMLDHVEVSQRELVRERLRLTEERPTVDLDCEIVWPDGSMHWITITGALTFDDSGEATRLIGTVSDITERRSREQERALLEQQLHHWQRVEAVGRLASGVAHDFNNVLTAVNGWAELISNEAAADDQIVEHAGAIASATAHGRQLTDQLLAIGREQTPGAVDVDVNAVARSTASMLGRLVPDDVAICADLHPIPAIRIDPTHLSQILLNLVINARDAMPTGGRITIASSHRVDAGDEPPGSVLLAVSDTGLGIAPDVLAHLFEPYFTTKASDAGTGLGLSIVETLVQRARGTVAVESTLGAGSTFTITFPSAGRSPESPELTDGT